MVNGTRDHAEALWDEVTNVLAPMGLRLSEEKTRVCHIDEGLDFLGWRIQRRNWRGRAGKKAIYTYPSKKSLASIIGKIRLLTARAKHRTLADLLRRLNPVLRGWCQYFRHGVSKRTFGYIDHYAFWRVVGWLRKRHPKLNMHTLVRRHLPGWEITAEFVEEAAWELARSNDDSWQAFLSVNSSESLQVRVRRPGEKYQPLGMAGHAAKVKDVMINIKMPAALRKRWPIVANSRQLLWLVGHQIDERARVLPGGEAVRVICRQRAAEETMFSERRTSLARRMQG